MNFENKTILITGASSGIGLELARQLFKINCRVAILARRDDVLQKIMSEYKDSPAKILPVKCNVADKEEVKKAFSKVKTIFGFIDVAILNAGVSFRSSIEDFNLRKTLNVYEVNVFGLINCIDELLPDYKKEKKGIIAGVSSLADSRGFSKSGAYCSSKAAASIILEGFRIELKKYNVKVITVKPGFVRTPMTDKNEFKMPFLMEPFKAARIIKKGIEKEKNIIQFPWPVVLGTKLLKVLPDFIFEFISERAK